LKKASSSPAIAPPELAGRRLSEKTLPGLAASLFVRLKDQQSALYREQGQWQMLTTSVSVKLLGSPPPNGLTDEPLTTATEAWF
jgi:hypothetical protein